MTARIRFGCIRPCVLASVDTLGYSSGMIIPSPEAASAAAPVASARETWSKLQPENKCERLLDAAAEVFTRDGLEAPMSEVADAAGAGVASVYRQFPSKHELLAALVIRRMDQIAVAVDEAQQREGDRWSALVGLLRWVVERQSADDFMGEARAVVAGHPEVALATERAATAWERLLAEARTEGRLRADATVVDLQLLFAATRAAKRVEPEWWPRMLDLMIDALDSQPRP
jgi:AcrR family transcriptional regulator